MFNIPELIEQVDKAPSEIASLERDLANVKAQLRQATEKLADTKTRYIGIVTVDKAKFPNKEARDVGVELLLQQDTDACTLRKDIARFEAERDLLEIRIKEAKDRFSVARYKLRLYTAETSEKAASTLREAFELMTGLASLAKGILLKDEEVPF